jgi:hypothetical protein
MTEDEQAEYDKLLDKYRVLVGTCKAKVKTEKHMRELMEKHGIWEEFLEGQKKRRVI